MRVLISGSRGFIGTALVERLSKDNHDVVRLVRNNPEEGDIAWDAETGAVEDFALEGFDAVVHLGGVSLGEKRWSETEKGRIWDSRVNTTDFLAQRLAMTINRPRVFVVASGLGFYGDRGEDQLDESSSQGEGFLSQVVRNWEEAAETAVKAGIRTVHLRSGVVLGLGGGILQRLLPVFRTALGGNLGSGTQYMSWISLRDEVNAIVFAITDPRISGPINLCSPNPVTNREFTKTFGEVLKRPTFIPVWPWLLKLAFGAELTEEMLLVSQRAYPKKLEKAGFQFQDRFLAPALRDILEPVTARAIADPDSANKHQGKKSKVPKIFRFDSPTPPPSRTSDSKRSEDDNDG